MAIRPCSDADLDAVLAVVNTAATAYEGAVPTDCFDVPYMSAAELRAEIGAGVRFWGLFDGEEGARGCFLAFLPLLNFLSFSWISIQPLPIVKPAMSLSSPSLWLI